MKNWKLLFGLAALLATAASHFTAHAATLARVTNVSSFPALTNEFYLTATNITTTFNGTNVHVMVYMDDPPGGGGAVRGIPSPLIELNVGQVVVCHFKNNLNLDLWDLPDYGMQNIPTIP